ncbi:CocE/NonD family hydrolase C-terminal non-catalytic domain-containing protein [Streptomyces sp. NPDC000941]
MRRRRRGALGQRVRRPDEPHLRGPAHPGAVQLWPTAHRFRRGHRIRPQISSGAFPRFRRNPGTGEPHSTATRPRTAEQQVLHDPDPPSAVILPVR